MEFFSLKETYVIYVIVILWQNYMTSFNLSYCDFSAKCSLLIRFLYQFDDYESPPQHFYLLPVNLGEIPIDCK